jgi:hypothetical protein
MTDERDKTIELAWGLIANAWDFVERESGPTSEEWIKAAERWRDKHWHTSLTTEPEADVRVARYREALEKITDRDVSEWDDHCGHHHGEHEATCPYTLAARALTEGGTP